jgi:predicted secreted protein
MQIMGPNIKKLTEKLEDERSKKLMFVAHCILNENSRYQGGAFRKGPVNEIVDELQKRGIGIIQMPCPERIAWGGVLRRLMWLPLGSKGTLLYSLRPIWQPAFILYTKMIFRSIARNVVSEIRDYSNSGFDVMGIIGVASSPTCGVTQILDLEQTIEYAAITQLEALTRKEMNEFGISKLIMNGEGYYISALKDELKKKKLSVKFYEYNLLAEMKGELTSIDL